MPTFSRPFIFPHYQGQITSWSFNKNNSRPFLIPYFISHNCLFNLGGGGNLDYPVVFLRGKLFPPH